ncbi:MAG: D-alanyl-D-alanine carboxypeptidase family protein [Granulosicoccus sp.]
MMFPLSNKRISLVFFIPVLMLAGIASQSVAAPLPAPPQLSANSFLLIDHVSGEVLAEKEPDKRIEPASLTKIMTAYLVASELGRGGISMDEPVIISDEAQAMPGSRMFVEASTTVSVADLLRGLIIQSGNDASVALAEHIAASEGGFVDMMNRMAETLGMKSTHYANASGLPDPEHYTTATDLAKVAQAMIRDFPEVYALYAERHFTFNEIKQKNRNTLLWRDVTVDGMKTGHTKAAGYCLVASAVREDMRLISVVLGTASDKTRIAESQRLLNYGYRFFRTERIYAAGELVSEPRIWMGKQETIALGVEKDLYVTLPRDDFERLNRQIEVNDYIKAPANIGQEFGRSVLMADNKIIGEVPLLALQKVEEGGIFLRMKHSIMRYFQ